jgi:hypothetical protein
VRTRLVPWLTLVSIVCSLGSVSGVLASYALELAGRPDPATPNHPSSCCYRVIRGGHAIRRVELAVVFRHWPPGVPDVTTDPEFWGVAGVVALPTIRGILSAQKVGDLRDEVLHVDVHYMEIVRAFVERGPSSFRAGESAVIAWER